MRGQALISAKASQLAQALLGTTSIYANRGGCATTPTFEDYNVVIFQANGVTNPAVGSKLSFNLPKNSTLIGNAWIEIQLSPGTTINGATTAVPFTFGVGTANRPQAEYVKNVGDLIVNYHQLQYGNTQLQQFDGRFDAVFRRLCRNDVNIEAINAQVLGNLPPSTNPAGPEAVLCSAFYNGVTLYVPLEELFFCKTLDNYWMPEAYALEGQILSYLTNLGQIINTHNRTASEIVVFPSIVNCRLHYEEVTLSAAEKDNRLKFYRTPEGLVNTWMDLEFQKGVQFRGNVVRTALMPLAQQPLITRVVQLNNLRMDMAELVFTISRAATTLDPTWFPQENATIADWSGSFLEGDTSPSLIIPNDIAGSGFSTLIDLDSFTIKAAGKPLYAEAMPEFWNRTSVRKMVHKDSQIVAAVYTIPFARFPEDCKNATGFMSASVLGTLTLDLVFRDPGQQVTYEMNLYSRAYNLMQSRGGGISAALK